jgi:hypothetical protein
VQGTKVHGGTAVVVGRLRSAAVVELRRATGTGWRESH